jgi:23S rRNA (cytidine2498-2'-O)-methyltransferase
MSTSGRVMFSTAEESFGPAVRELRDEFGEQLQVEHVGPDLGVVSDVGLEVGDVAAACAAQRLVFPRHLTVEVDWVPRVDAVDPRAVADAALRALADHPAGAELALQTWTSGPAEMDYSAGELSGHIARHLDDHGFAVYRSGKPYVLSCAVTRDGVSIGLNRVEDSLSDWPGGRTRLGRDDTQISRAEFKLEELFQTFPLRLPAGGLAVDLGASPGGWTRILRGHDLTVWAVDPGDLDPRIGADRRVHHARMTAGEFLRRTDMTFDLAVNDMRMDPGRSCQVMLDATPHLRRGAIAVVTLKIGKQRPLETVHHCLRLLAKGYRIEFARQLHHNRHEVTVVARRS